ncbi:hypothetical protein D3C73_1591400 [compost metagenome]
MDQDHRLTRPVILVVELNVRGVLGADLDEAHDFVPFSEGGERSFSGCVFIV